MEEKCVSLDYEREYERVSMQLKEAMCELEEYKRALLNICLKV